MNNRDIEAVVAGLFPVVRDFVARSQQPLREAVDVLANHVRAVEARTPERGPPGRDGIDGASPDVGKLVDAALDAVGEPLQAVTERINALEARTYELPPAPDDIADQVASTIAMLAESPPLQRSYPAAAVAPRPRSFTFEHDEDGKIVGAHEGGDA